MPVTIFLFYTGFIQKAVQYFSITLSPFFTDIPLQLERGLFEIMGRRYVTCEIEAMVVPILGRILLTTKGFINGIANWEESS